MKARLVHYKMGVLKDGVLLTKRGFTVSVFFFFIFFTLYYVLSLYVLKYVAIALSYNLLILQVSFNFTLAITLLFTSFLIRRFNKLHVIYACSAVTSIITGLLFSVSNNIFSLVCVFAAGIFFCTGQLAFFSYFWNLTVAEERGRIAGLIGFIALPFYFIVDPFIVESLDFSGVLILSISLSLGPLLVALMKPEKALLITKKDEEGNHPERRTILFYSIPWVMFSLINATLARNMSLDILRQVPSSFYVYLTLLQVTGAFFGTLFGGIIADFFGRRIILASSLTLYGISSALAGLVQNYAAYYFVYVANGLSWGMLLTLYSFVVWGDLSNKDNCAKMYSIGLATFYLTTGVGLLTQISQISLVVSSLAACLLIFLSNVPIVLAPEILPSDFRERIRLKLHMQALKKIEKQAQN